MPTAVAAVTAALIYRHKYSVDVSHYEMGSKYSANKTLAGIILLSRSSVITVMILCSQNAIWGLDGKIKILHVVAARFSNSSSILEELEVSRRY